MATRNRLMSINVDAISDLADRVGRLDADALAAATVTALNDTIDRTYEMARERITVGINLSDDYLRRRMEVVHADRKKHEASITATGDRSSMTRLASYNAAMVLVSRTSTRPSRAKGLLPTVVPRGQKQGGVSVSVTRGSTKTLGTGFMLPLRSGGALGEKFGVFQRRNGKLKHLFGPSVYQLFAYQIPRIEDEVLDDLQSTMMQKVDEELERILA